MEHFHHVITIPYIKNTILLCTDLSYEKILWVPQISILTLCLRNLTLHTSYTRAYAAHQGKRELVSLVAV